MREQAMTRLIKGRTIVRTLLLAGAATVSFAAAGAHAQGSQVKHYNIPAGDAGASIQTLARQAGIQVMAPQADLRGVRTARVSGDFTVTQALQHMLAGTNLQVVTQDGAVIVRKRTIAAAGGGGASEPQDVAEEVPTEEEQQIIVTGTRIERAGVDTIQAATVTDEEEIDRRAYTNVIQALADTPGFAPPANSQIGTSQGNLGIAQSFSNFFGLGSQRTLTLVNGRRFVSSNTVSGTGGATAPGSQVDVNLIPVGLVERIETVAIGGAPVYGSDAISGTVNFILKKDYEGIELTGQASISDRGDAANQVLRGMVGKNFFDGRANIVLSAEYVRQEGMVLHERFPALALLPTATAANRTDGIAGLTPVEQVFAFMTEGGLPFRSGTLPSDATLLTTTGATVASGGIPVQFGPDGSLIPFNRGARYNGDSGGLLRNGGDGVNPADHALLLSPNDRIVANAIANFDVTENINLFFEGSYAHTSGTKLSDLFQFAAPGGAGGPSITFAADNPFLSSQARSVLATNGITGSQTFRFNRNLNDVADSQPAMTELDVWRVVVGAEGDFSLWGEKMNWDVAYNFGRSKNTSEFNQINQARFLAAIDVVSTGGAIQCRSGGSCIPLNLFGQNAFSPEAAAAVIDKGIGISTNELEEITANVGGRLPFGIAEPISFSVGYAHRSESGSFDGNAIINGGLSLLGGGVAFPDAPKRGFKTNEVYGETVIPLVDDEMGLPLIKVLEFEGAVRYVDHSVSGGDMTWSAGGRLRPRFGDLSEGLTLRGVFTHAIRSPSIVELFLNPTPVARGANDVCAPGRVGAGLNPTARLANCTAALAAVGAPPPSGTGTLFAPTTNVASPFGTVGGNPNLDNEKADSWSVGLVWQPSFIPRLRINVDYSEIKVNGAISRFTLITAQAACYDSANYPNEPACAAFSRLTAAQAAAQTAATGRNRVAGDIADGYAETYFNSSVLDFAGIIGEIDYRIPIGNFMGGSEEGALRFNAKAFHIKHFRSQTSPATAVVDSAGTVGTPSWRVNGRIGISADPIDFDVNVIWNDNVVLDPAATIEDISPEINNVPSYALVNASLGFRIGESFNLQFAVRNLFDKGVPFPGVVNRSYGVFDPIGRTYTATATARF
jgi:iron complex outermembrane recepter protein